MLPVVFKEGCTNVPIKAIMERVGHLNEKMILQVCSHVKKNMQENFLLKMNERVF